VISDPAAAPPRPDLTFLRHRSRPKPSPAAEFITGQAPHPHHHVHAAPPGSPDPPAPPSASLDLSAPAPPSASLDLSAPAAPPRSAAPSAAPSTSLDLAGPPAPAAPAAAGPPRPSAPQADVHKDRRIRAGMQQLLSVKEPTVTLTRVQSGIGQLEIQAVCSPELGDVRLGAAYQLRDGSSSTVQYAGGNRFAPSTRRPLIVAGRNEYEHLAIDLRQVRDLERIAVYAFSESRAELTWGGTLVLTTFGGARVELPLETLRPGAVAVLMSIYNLDGELVIRAEMETIPGDVREAARAYGYDRITWRDDRSPVD
jgi:uncharacterized protein involved in tellurium resistance